MPTDVAIIVVGVVAVFAVFAGGLGWAAFYTRGVRTPGAAYFDGK